MGRTILSSKTIEIEKQHIGKIIVFCEGMTEKLYLDYFTQIINKDKFTDIKIEIESADGNARRVLNFANKFLNDEQNNAKFANHEKYLMFDCDAPDKIQEVILDMKAEKKYSLLVSNFLFEVWLLMYFEDVDSKLTKRQIYKRLEENLNCEYEKANEGMIRAIINNGNFEMAIKTATALSDKYKLEGKDILLNIAEMNPYTNVHELIVQLMLAIS
jgi:hypothetical protein